MKLRPWLFLVPVLSASLPAQESSANLLKLVVSLHNRVYGHENLLIKPFSKPPRENDVEIWRDLMARTRKFVTSKGDKRVNAAMMKRLEGASENLINLRKIYFNVIRVALSPESRADGLSNLDKSRIDFSRINLPKLKSDLAGATQGDLKELQELRRTVANINQTLAGRKSRSDLEEKECLSLLGALGATLEATLGKLNKDAEKIAAAGQ